jgi:hypothetical protein
LVFIDANKLGDPFGNPAHIVTPTLEFIAAFKPFVGFGQDRQHN